MGAPGPAWARPRRERALPSLHFPCPGATPRAPRPHVLVPEGREERAQGDPLAAVRLRTSVVQSPTRRTGGRPPRSLGNHPLWASGRKPTALGPGAMDLVITQELARAQSQQGGLGPRPPAAGTRNPAVPCPRGGYTADPSDPSPGAAGSRRTRDSHLGEVPEPTPLAPVGPPRPPRCHPPRLLRIPAPTVRGLGPAGGWGGGAAAGVDAVARGGGRSSVVGAGGHPAVPPPRPRA